MKSFKTSATIVRPGTERAETKSVVGNYQEIEENANKFGGIRVEFASGEVWRKLFNEWIVVKG